MVRINVIVPYEILKECIGLQTDSSLMMNVLGVFIATDGYLDSKTAALVQPYSDEPDNKGRLLLH